MLRTRLTAALWGTYLLCCAAAVLVLLPPLGRRAQRVWAHLTARAAWQRVRQAGCAPNTSGAAAAWLRLPAAGIDTLVVWGATRANLARYPCLHSDLTAADPGASPVLVVILAHRDTHFRGLRHLRIGDRLELEGPHGAARVYHIADTEVLAPEAVAARLTEKRAEPWVALLTCYPFRYVGPAPRRFIAWARPAVQLHFTPRQPNSVAVPPLARNESAPRRQGRDAVDKSNGPSLLPVKDR